MTTTELFISIAQSLKKPSVLELGTLQSNFGTSTMHKNWVPNAAEFLGTDIQAGPDVDIVADAHRLSSFLNNRKFDIIISCSTFEHFKYPHLAALEISKSLKIGGILFIQTHHTFPLHAYPYDYFRFSIEALESCFGTKNGITVLNKSYSFDATITSNRIGTHKAFLNTNLYAEKTHETPENFIYEFDTDLIT